MDHSKVVFRKSAYSVNIINVELTEVPFEQAAGQYYFACQILNVNLWYPVESTEQFNHVHFTKFTGNGKILQAVKLTDNLRQNIKTTGKLLLAVIIHDPKILLMQMGFEL